MERPENQLSFEDVSLPYVRWFRITGILPFKGKTSSYFGTRILFGYFIFMNFLLWSSYVCYSFNVSKLQIETICETILLLSVSMRYYLLIWKRKDVEDLLAEMKAIWDTCTEEGQRIVSTFERRMRRLQKFYIFVVTMGNVLYPINALIIRLPPSEPNGTERQLLPYKWYTENAEEMWPGYWTIFTIQFVVVQSSCVHFYLCGTALGGFIMIATGYFCYLKNELLRIVENTQSDDDSKTSDDYKIVRFIEFHQNLLALSEKLDKLSQTLLLIQITTTCYNVSLIGFKLASSDPDRSKYLSIFFGSVMQLYLCQWSPDCLYDESKQIGLAAYATSIKYLHRPLQGKFLVLIILRAQRPVQIKAGGFFPLSLETFGSMMTSAFSFFTMLRRFDL